MNPFQWLLRTSTRRIGQRRSIERILLAIGTSYIRNQDTPCENTIGGNRAHIVPPTYTRVPLQGVRRRCDQRLLGAAGRFSTSLDSSNARCGCPTNGAFTIAPGHIDTDIVKSTKQEVIDSLIAETPGCNRIGRRPSSFRPIPNLSPRRATSSASTSTRRPKRWCRVSDEKSQIQALDRTQPILPLAPGL